MGEWKGLRSYDSCCDENVAFKKNFALCEVFRDESKLVMLNTNGFSAKARE